MKNNESSSYSIRIIDNFEEMNEIVPYWSKHSRHPNADYDYYKKVIESSGSEMKPKLLLIFKDDNPVLLVVGRLENHRFDCKFGYKTVYSPNVKTFVVIYGGIIGDVSEETCEIFLEEIMKLLKRGEAELLMLSNIPLEGALYKVTSSSKYALLRDKSPVESTHWQMKMPESMDEFLKARSSKHRYWLKRMDQQLEKDYRGNIEIKRFSKEEDIVILCKDAELVAKKTYQRELDAGFIDNEKMRCILSLLADKDLLRTYILYLNSEPCAFWIGNKYKDVFHLSYTGYDPRYKKYELGTILFMRMLEDLCSDGTIKTMDFGFGDALYKSRFGDLKWHEASVYIYPLNLKGIKLKMIRYCVSQSYQYSVDILKKFNLLEKVKRTWRDKLIERKENDVKINEG